MTLSLADVEAEFTAIAGDTLSVFGLLDEQQLNWGSWGCSSQRA
jgi:hypothetical protein